MFSLRNPVHVCVCMALSVLCFYVFWGKGAMQGGGVKCAGKPYYPGK